MTTSRKLSTGVDARNVHNIVLMRPCNNMIEFKQIVVRGTRVYEGKEFFTIYDFVKAHHNFADPDWDGEPIVPGVAADLEAPAVAEVAEVLRMTHPTKEKIVIKLSDGKTGGKPASSVMYWSPQKGSQ